MPCMSLCLKTYLRGPRRKRRRKLKSVSVFPKISRSYCTTSRKHHKLAVFSTGDCMMVLICLHAMIVVITYFPPLFIELSEVLRSQENCLFLFGGVFRDLLHTSCQQLVETLVQ